MGEAELYSGEVLEDLFEGLKRSTIKSWRDSGLLPPASTDRRGYTFQDLLSIKVILRLKRWGTTTRHIKEAVDTIKRLYPHLHNPLTEKTLFVCGKRVCILIDGEIVDPLNGQTYLFRLEDYTADFREKAAPFRKTAAAPATLTRRRSV